MQTTPGLHISRDRFHLAWDPAIAPIEDGRERLGGGVRPARCVRRPADRDSTPEDLGRLDFERVDQVNGPIAVDGAEPGDTLQIELLEFEPADWGWTANIPGFGLLADDFPDPYLRITRLPRAGERASSCPACASRSPRSAASSGSRRATGPRSTIPPDVHGGNMDTRHLTAGATLFLPVFAARRPLVDGRRPRRPGRRRGVRHGHRDADARRSSGSRCARTCM